MKERPTIAGGPPQAVAAAPPAPPRRRSARWARARAGAPRYLLVGALVLLCLGGLKEIVVGDPVPKSGGGGRGIDHAEERLALDFTRAYLSYDAARPQRRERALASYLPDNLDSDGGFTPARGSRQVLWTEVAQNQVALAGGRVVVVEAQADDQAAPHFLAVNVDRDRRGSLFIAGYPAMVGAPSINRRPVEPDREVVEEVPIRQMVERVVSNYLSSSTENLAADLDPKTTVTLPTSRLRLVEVDEIYWTSPKRDAALATVVASDRAGNQLTLSYELGVRDRGRPLVTFIQTIPTKP